MTSSDSGNEPDNPSEDLPPTHQPYGTPPPPPQNPYGSPPADQPAQPPYGQPQYGAPQYPQQPPYGQPQYGQPQYGAPQYPQPPGYGHPGYGPGAPQNHPSATTALVLSIIGLAGVAFCGGLTLVLSPFAWRMGAKAVEEIDANPGAYGGRDQANAARIMGVIGTVLLVLGVLGIVGLIAVGVASGS